MELDSALVWSEDQQAVVQFTVEKTTETDEGGNETKVILVSNGNEKLRFSPNFSSDELTKALDDYNAEHQAEGNR